MTAARMAASSWDNPPSPGGDVGGTGAGSNTAPPWPSCVPQSEVGHGAGDVAVGSEAGPVGVGDDARPEARTGAPSWPGAGDDGGPEAGAGALAVPPLWLSAGDDAAGPEARAGVATPGAGDDVGGLEARAGTGAEPAEPKKNTAAARPSSARIEELAKEAMDTPKERRKVAEDHHIRMLQVSMTITF